MLVIMSRGATTLCPTGMGGSAAFAVEAMRVRPDGLMTRGAHHMRTLQRGDGWIALQLCLLEHRSQPCTIHRHRAELPRELVAAPMSPLDGLLAHHTNRLPPPRKRCCVVGELVQLRGHVATIRPHPSMPKASEVPDTNAKELHLVTAQRCRSTKQRENAAQRDEQVRDATTQNIVTQPNLLLPPL